jgi:hypothetical protein
MGGEFVGKTVRSISLLVLALASNGRRWSSTGET